VRCWCSSRSVRRSSSRSRYSSARSILARRSGSPGQSDSPRACRSHVSLPI